MEQHKEIINQWSESAPYWEKYRTVIREMFAPVTQALIEDAGITNGHTVLDVAMGPGEPALSIVDVVGPQGKVVGTDAVTEMVEAAGREGERRGLHNATFQVAFGDSLPFPANAFDAVVSRFGVMFFPSPIDGVREMLRVLKPGGRFAVAVWHYAERNPFFSVYSQIVDRYAEPSAPAPDAPDAFRFAAPGKLLTILREAGATATSERLLQFSIRASMPAEDFWTLRSEMSEKLRTKLARLSGAQLADLRREVIEAIRAYSSGDEIRFPAEVLVVSGRKN
ncbi:MAG TPA: class I SAM-dependent methyltransferase [Candidatus Acidoferrum sp.]|jgi:ubiquinone/menaquinone biosynthesis C-methylase UbiE